MRNVKSNKIFEVIWTEIHSIYVKAKNEIEAKDNACNGSNILTDESVELDESPVARELTKEELKKIGLK